MNFYVLSGDVCLQRTRWVRVASWRLPINDTEVDPEEEEREDEDDSKNDEYNPPRVSIVIS